MEQASRGRVIYAGVELGGTKCVAILADGDRQVLAREIIPTAAPDETLDCIENLLTGWKRDQGFDALGIASFGPIDTDPDSANYGSILNTPKPGWANTIVAPRLQQAAAVPGAFDTDVNGAALAEMRWGSGRGFDDFAYVTVGTGIGVGLVVNGQPTRGFGHCELGHVRVARFARDVWPGSCPYHGDCVEGLASGSSLEARLGDRIKEIGSDDPVWDSIGWTLAQLCHVIVCAAAPRRIAMGGGVMEAQPHLLGRINGTLAQSLNGFLQLPADGAYVRMLELGSDAGPLGAIALAMTAAR